MILTFTCLLLSSIFFLLARSLCFLQFNIGSLSVLPVLPGTFPPVLLHICLVLIYYIPRLSFIVT
jgi:hypothetical protein